MHWVSASDPIENQMNQIEIWFSILVRKVIKRGNFTSWMISNARFWLLSNTTTVLWQNLSSGLIKAEHWSLNQTLIYAKVYQPLIPFPSRF